MKRLIMVENKKFFKNKKNKFIILIILLLVIFLPLIRFKNKNKYYERIQKNMEEQKKISENLYYLLINTKYDYIDEDYLLYLEEDIIKSLILEQYYKEKKFSDWKQILKIYNDKYNNIIYGYENNFISDYILLVRDQEMSTLKASIFLNNYLLDNDIKYEFNPYEINGKNFLLILIESNNSIIILILLILLSIDAFYFELEGGKYRIYYTQPYTRDLFFKAKIYNAIVLPVLIFLLVLLVIFMITSIIFGTGDLSYPKVIVSKDILFNLIPNSGTIVDFQIISTSKFLLLNYFLFFIMIIFFSCLSNIIVLFTDSLKASLGIITSLIMFDNMKEQFISKSSKVRFYLPIEYMDPIKVLEGNTNTSYFIGVALLTILTIIMTTFGFYKFRSKDIIGGKD